MNILGLSPKDFKSIADSVAPDGWISVSSGSSGKTRKVPSQEQIEAVRAHLEKVHMLDKKREYLLAMIERLRPEVEKNNYAESND